MRKTKIVCTLGPATEDKKTLKELIQAGMNVARLNFSHGNHEEHLLKVNIIKELRDEMNLPLALLLDTKGPEIRLKKFKDKKVTLQKGDLFILTTEDIEGTEKKVSVTYSNLPKDINRGDRILIDDGLIELKVLNKTDRDIECEIINGGEVSDRKGVNVPGVSINLPFLSDRDKSDILFGIKNNFDYIAASFVRNADCARELKEFLSENSGSAIKLISKIENSEGVQNIKEIIAVSDGIMVARGDMGVEIPFEDIPSVQKDIIKKCYFAGKPVITATQMLDSMIRNPRPTRAEITDVANAIYDGTSAIMLSGETSIGKYPIDAVNTMKRISLKTEDDINYSKRLETLHSSITKNITDAISYSTCTTAHSLGASAIVTVTKSGDTAKNVSKFRPSSPIIAVTIKSQVYHQLALSWGVLPVLAKIQDSNDKIFSQAVQIASQTDLVNNGDLIVLTGGMLADISGTTNTLQVHIVGDVLLKGKGIGDVSIYGKIFIAHENDNSTEQINSGDIIVIQKTTDQILHLLKNASGIITEEEEKDSEAVIVAKALNIPTISNAKGAVEILKNGSIVTINPQKGLVFNGMNKESLK